jgi:hypothetical protein
MGSFAGMTESLPLVRMSCIQAHLYLFRVLAINSIPIVVIRGGANHDLPEVRKKQCASLASVARRSGSKLALDETLSLPRMPASLLRLPVRGEVVEASDPGREAHHEAAPQYSLEAHTRRTNPVRHQFVDLPGNPLFHHSATRRQRVDRDTRTNFRTTHFGWRHRPGGRQSFRGL